MQYIHLTNDSYIINTSEGSYTLSRNSFNFNKIKRLLSNNEEENKILPLLQKPDLPNGIYRAYLSPTNNILYYQHLHQKSDGVLESAYKDMRGKFVTIGASDDKLVGVYASLEDLVLDWPEYTI